MRKLSVVTEASSSSATGPTEISTVLSVSPLDSDHSCLEDILGRSCWLLVKAHDLVAAFSLLQQHDIAVVVCERDLLPGTWIDMLEHTKALPSAPSLIVTSRLADEYLWAEALNLGAWDVLAKPFDRLEVSRCVEAGWRHWRRPTARAAAG